MLTAALTSISPIGPFGEPAARAPSAQHLSEWSFIHSTSFNTLWGPDLIYSPQELPDCMLFPGCERHLDEYLEIVKCMRLQNNFRSKDWRETAKVQM